MASPSETSEPASSETQNKKAKMDMDEMIQGEDEKEERIKNAVEGIRRCQDEIDDMNREHYSEEVLQVEQRFYERRKQLYTRRNEYFAKLPSFWSTTMLQHPQLGALIVPAEKDCLSSLKEVVVAQNEDIKSGYQIEFHFDSNDFFSNEMLVKKFEFSNSVAVSSSTDIDWKDGKNIVEHFQAHDQDEQLPRLDTFFVWLTDHSNPVNDEVAEIIKDKLWAKDPLKFYFLEEQESD